MTKKLPNKITYTVKQKKTQAVDEAFGESLLNAIPQCSPKSKEIIRKARIELCKNGPIIKICKNAFDVIQNAPTVYAEEIIENIPEEIWNLLEERFL